MNPAYIVFAASYIKTFDKHEAHGDMKEYLDVAIRLALDNPLFASSEKAIKLWDQFSEKIGVPDFQRANVFECFQQNKLLSLKNHPNPRSLFPLQVEVSGNGYVLMNQESGARDVLIFQGCASNDVQKVLEFRLYSCSVQYDSDFDTFRMNMHLVDYDTKIGLLVIESLVSDPNILLNFKSYSNLWLQGFITNNKQNMVAARLNPLDMKSQMFMHDYISVAESMQFSKTQCIAAINAFLKDLIDASIQDPLSAYNEQCIRNWVLRYSKYYSELEMEYILENFYSAKLNFIRFSGTERIETRLPAKIKIAKCDFIITRELGRGGYGVAFNGYVQGVPQDDLVIKLLFPNKPNSRESFYNEIIALSKLKRLVLYDASVLVICQKKIKGTPLDLVLGSCQRGSELEKSLSVKYMNLCQNFYDKYGLIHGDVRPENVIADKNQNLELIDFGMTRSGSHFGSNAQAVLEQDIMKAYNEYEYFFARLQAQKALDNPLDKLSRQKILEYMSSLQKTNRIKDLQIWTRYYQQKCCSLKKSKSN